MTTSIIITIVLATIISVLVITLIGTGIKIVPQSNAFVIERIGKYHTTWNSGIHFRIPIVDRIAKRISLKEQVANFDPQTVITKDNVTMGIDTVLFFQITDTKLYSYGVEQPIVAIENLTATTLRNVIGDLELDKTLTSRDEINGRLQITLDEATSSWGIKVVRVEVKNIQPPREVKDSMEKQMRAEREKRAAILTAEGEKAAAILTAEGDKAARILSAEGKAQALLVQQKALASSIDILNKSKPCKEVLTLRSLETMEKVADGSATKIIIPSHLATIAGTFTTLGELFNEKTPSNKKVINKVTKKINLKDNDSINVKPQS